MASRAGGSAGTLREHDDGTTVSSKRTVLTGTATSLESTLPTSDGTVAGVRQARGRVAARSRETECHGVRLVARQLRALELQRPNHLSRRQCGSPAATVWSIPRLGSSVDAASRSLCR